MDHAIHWLITTPCVVHHYDTGPADAYGDHTVEVVNDTDEVCNIQQSSRSEDTGIEFDRWNLYFLPGVDIDANDRVTVAGMDLVFDGQPWTVVDPVTGWATHIEATAIRTR